MTVLVTRPSPDGEMLCKLLEAAGFEAAYQPIIEFAEGQDGKRLHAVLERSDFVIFVSKPAVEWADKILHSQMQQWPDSPCYLAVGQKTADKLSELVAQKVHCPRVSDSEHLLRLAPLSQPYGARIAIIRGNGGRELIRNELLKRGARVEYCEVYQRRKLTFDGRVSVKLWRKSKVDHVVITSGEQLEYFVSNIPETEIDWLLKQTLIVPSNRIADLADELGFHKVIVSGSASNPELVAVLRQLCTTGQAHDK